MNETIVKHAAGTGLSLTGWVGSVSLSDVNHIASIACSVVGVIAGILTIISCIKHIKKDK